MDETYLTPTFSKFLESNRDLFMRCDRDGKEKPDGKFWCTRIKTAERGPDCMVNHIENL